MSLAARQRRRLPIAVYAYPPRWRRAHGADLAELLDSMAEDGALSLRDSADVVRAGCRERLSATGRLPLTYAWIVLATVLSAAIWSQLSAASRTAVGSGRALPSTIWVVAATTKVIGPVLVVLLVLMGARLVLSGWTAVRTGAGRRAAALVAMLCAAFGALTMTGWWAGRSGWYTPAGASLPAHGLPHLVTLWVRGAVSAITPAWIHPGLFSTMPLGEAIAAWTAVPAVIVVALVAARLVALTPPDRRLLRLDVAVGAATVLTLSTFTAAAASWVVHIGTPGRATTDAWRGTVIAPGHTGIALVAALAAFSVLAWISLRYSATRARELPAA